MADEEAAAGGMGSVKPLADAISVEQAEKAAKKVRGAISHQQQQVEELQKFKDENKSLSKLVLQLPDVVSHSIMVPFGKVAFFPGRLIHTNEFLFRFFLEEAIMQNVLPSKQLRSSAGLVEIREDYNEAVEGQMDPISNPRVSSGASSSLPNSMSRDFTMGSESVTRPPATSNQPASLLADAIEGSELVTKKASSSTTIEDPAHDALMARLSEIELAEAAAADGGEDNDDDDEDMDEEDNDGRAVPALWSDLHKGRISRTKPMAEKSDNEEDDIFQDENTLLVDGSDEEEDVSLDYGSDGSDDEEEEDYEDDDDEMNFPGAEVTDKVPGKNVWNMDIREYQKDKSHRRKPLSRFAREVHSASQQPSALKPSSSQHFLQHIPSQKTQLNHVKSQSATMEMPGMREKAEVSNDFTQELQEWRRGHASTAGHVLAERNADNETKISSLQPDYSDERLGESAPAEAKAFTGIVVERRQGAPGGFPAFVGGVTEHGYSAPTTSSDKQVEQSQPSRPVSKFKMRQAQGTR